MSQKYIDKDVVVREDIEIAMSNFVPRFGVEGDVRIAQEYSDLLNLLSLQKRDVVRLRQLRQMTKAKSARMKEIEQKEDHLLWLLKNKK